jgi:hypothetical protein
MAIAIAILSTEHGKNTLTTIAASIEEAADVYGTVNKHNSKVCFMSPDNPRAIQYLTRAYEVIGNHWETDHKTAGNAKAEVMATGTTQQQTQAITA